METKKDSILSAEYYDSFRCLAADCKCDCCHGWTINVPRRCYNKIRSMRKSDELAALVEEGIVRNRQASAPMFYALMKLQDNGDCVFLDENRLCKMQRECGHAVLPDVCKEFPRRVAIRESVVTLVCSTACEAVVDALWKLPLGLRFHCEPRTGPIRGFKTAVPEAREALYSRYEDVLNLTVSILQNRAYSLDGRMILLGLALRSLPEDAKDPAEIGAWRAKYAGFTRGGGFRETVANLPKNSTLFLSNNAATLGSLLTKSYVGYATILIEILDNLNVRMEERYRFDTDAIARREDQYFFDMERYRALEGMLKEILSPDDPLLENVMVNEWFYLGAPMDGTHSAWESYLRFCVLYSLLKFMLVGSTTEETREDDIVRTVVSWSRLLLHGQKQLDELVRQLIDNHSDSLAHMAILIQG